MKIQMMKNKKTVMFIGAALLLCLIAAGIYAIVANSDEKKLARQLELGQKYLDEMNYEQAIVAFEAAIVIDPKCEEAYLGMTEAYVALNDVEKAIEVLEQGYEQTGSDRIFQRLDELEGNAAEENAEIAETGDTSENEYMMEDSFEEEEDFPYYEIGFSPEDFTIAGYSIMDGKHLSEVEAAIRATGIATDEEIVNTKYTGWIHSEMYDEICVSYIWQGQPQGYMTGFYYKEDDYGITIWAQDGLNGSVVEPYLTDYPLVSFKAVPEMMSYQETLQALGIDKMVEYIVEMGVQDREWSKQTFETQLGKIECSYIEYDGTQIVIDHDQWSISLCFEDDVLHSFGIWSNREE